MKVFISYARNNRSKVEELQEILHRAGHDAWFDREISGGEHWWVSIIASIKTCDVFVFALTSESTNSDACRAEYQYALDLNKPILPVMLSTAELPIGKLQETQYVDARNLKSNDTILELARALTRLNERINAGEFAVPDSIPNDPPFPFPPDPLEGVRSKLQNLRTLPEEELLNVVYQIRQVSRQSEKMSSEARKLLERIANDSSLPYGVVDLARTSLATLPSKRRRRSSVSILVTLIIIMVIGLFYIILIKPIFYPTDTLVVEAPTTPPTETYTKTPTSVLTPTATPSPTNTIRPTQILTNTSHPEINIDNAAQVKEIAEPLVGHTSTVRVLEFSPDGKLLASGSSDFTVRIWDTQTQDLYWRINEHTNWVDDLSFSPDGSLLATVDRDGTMYIWSVPEKQKLKSWTYPEEIFSVDFSPDGNLIALGLAKGQVIIWDILNENIFMEWQGHTASVLSLTFNQNGTLLATGSSDGTTRIWEIASGEMIHNFETVRVEEILTIKFSPDERFIATGSDAGDEGGVVRIWDISLEKSIRLFASNTIRDLDFTPNGEILVIGGDTATVNLGKWEDVSDERIVAVNKLRAHTQPVRSVAVSPDGTIIASGGGDGDNSIRIWGVSD